MKVTIEGTQTQRVKVQVDKSELQEFAIEWLEQIFNLKSCYYYNPKDNTIEVEYEEHGGCHSWFKTKVIRKAKPDDRRNLDLLHMLSGIQQEERRNK